jgi:shikimate dehydrogenase
MSGGSMESICASTRFCAVLGHPIRHSASPAMQNAAIAALQLDWRYLAADVHPDHLRAAIHGAKATGFIGLNLTVPHKLLALEMVDEINAKAKLLGAVNTIVFEARNSDGQWTPLGRLPADPNGEIRTHGHNTDADSLIRSLKEEFQWPDLRGANVLLLGAGGAARSAALRLAEEGIGSLFIINRTREKATQLMAEVTTQFPSVTPGFMPDAADLIVNATSLGLKPDDPLPISLNGLKSCHPKRAYDMIYRPAETPFLRAAKSLGCQTANGLGMLLYQGAAALELWSGRPAPIDTMRAALRKNIYG